MRHRFPVLARRSLCSLLLALVSMLSGIGTSGHVRAMPARMPDYAWTIQPVDAPVNALRVALKFDDADQLHLALGGDHLYYATSVDGTAWTLETVDDTPGAGDGVALAVTGQESWRDYIASVAVTAYNRSKSSR